MERKCSLFVAGFLLLGMAVVGNVNAAVSEWVWSGTGLTIESSVDFINNDSYTFGITTVGDTNFANGITLLSSSLYTSTISISPVNTGFEAAIMSMGENTIQLNTLDLPTSEFVFYFDDGVDSPTTTYDLVEISGGYTLTSTDDEVSVTVLSNGVTPSAVPIPGSVLLLGSSLLGLLGIGSRRNKA